MKALIVDIGSNSIRAMYAESDASELGFSDKRVFTTRLAEGLVQSGELCPRRMAQSLDLLRQLKLEAEAENALLCAYATSAVRDAKNRRGFLDKAEELVEGRIAVLDGAQEARFAFEGAACGTGGLIDIGGGSTQLVTAVSALSFPIGCVRAKDLLRETDEFPVLYAALKPHLERVLPLPALDESAWTGVGGSITTLAALALGLNAYEREKINACRLSRAQIMATLHRIAALGAGRAEHSLLRERHDVILPGGAILLYLMDGLSIRELRISDADGMEGYAMHILLQNRCEKA